MGSAYTQSKVAHITQFTLQLQKNLKMKSGSYSTPGTNQYISRQASSDSLSSTGSGLQAGVTPMGVTLLCLFWLIPGTAFNPKSISLAFNRYANCSN